MSKKIEVNLEGMETIDLLHKSLIEEKEVDPKMAYRIQKYIEYENKKWMIEHKNDVFELNGIETSGINYIVARKVLELSNIIDLDNEENFEKISDEVYSYYDNITEKNVAEFNNSILLNINGENKSFNLCNNLEEYIINCDEEYAPYLDEQVDWFYENYTDYEKRKEESKEEPKVETVVKKGKPVEEEIVIKRGKPIEEETKVVKEPTIVVEEAPKEDLKTITTAAEWALALSDYAVVNKKLKLRK